MSNNTEDKLFQKLESAYRQYTGHLLQPAQVYPVGSYVYRTNGVPRGLHYINKGWVKVIREDDNARNPLIRLSGPGTFTGYISLILKKNYSASAIVIEKAEIQFIPRQVFLNLINTDLEFAALFIDIISKQLESHETKIADLIAKQGHQRLATLLLGLELAYDEDNRFDNSHIRLPKKELAAAIAVTPESVSRYLSDMAEKGLVKLEDNTIQLKDKSALIKIAGLKD